MGCNPVRCVSVQRADELLNTIGNTDRIWEGPGDTMDRNDRLPIPPALAVPGLLALLVGIVELARLGA